MSDRTVLASEEQYPWELDPWDEDRPARIRVRTLISGDRTPSSGVSMGVYRRGRGVRRRRVEAAAPRRRRLLPE